MSLSKILCILFGIIVSLFLSLGYKMLNDQGHFTKLTSYPQKNVQCEYNELKMGAAPEDLTKISEDIAVTGTSDRKQLWEDQLGPGKTPQGKLFAINLELNKVHEIKLINFPKDQKLQPHGIYYNFENKNLFVISHGYDGKPSRVLRFNIDQSDKQAIKATYITSYYVNPDLYNGIINDLIQIKEDEFLITVYQHVADPLVGRYKKDTLKKLVSQLKFLIGLEETFVISCKYDLTNKSNNLDCVPIQNSNARMANGITWNQQNEVVVADSLNKLAKVYTLNLNQPRDKQLEYQYTVELTRHPDNIEYDIYNKHYVVGGFGLIHEHMLFVSTEIYPKRSFWAYVDILKHGDNNLLTKENILLKDDAIKGCSAALTYKDKIYLGTWCDTNLVTCNL